MTTMLHQKHHIHNNLIRAICLYFSTILSAAIPATFFEHRGRFRRKTSAVWSTNLRLTVRCTSFDLPWLMALTRKENAGNEIKPS